MATWKALASAVEKKEAPRHVLMIEAHFGYEELGAHVLPDLKRIERMYASAAIHCPIVFVTRVRELPSY